MRGRLLLVWAQRSSGPQEDGPRRDSFADLAAAVLGVWRRGEIHQRRVCRGGSVPPRLAGHGGTTPTYRAALDSGPAWRVAAPAH